MSERRVPIVSVRLAVTAFVFAAEGVAEIATGAAELGMAASAAEALDAAD